MGLWPPCGRLGSIAAGAKPTAHQYREMPGGTAVGAERSAGAGQEEGKRTHMSQFRFCAKLDQTILLGKRAGTLPELLEGIRTVPKSSIYYHTHRFLQAHHYLTPEPSNDFAYWCTEVLNDVLLGEQLSSIDIVGFNNIADLQARLAEIVAGQIRGRQRTSEAPPGEEFHFMASRLFVMQTQHVATTLAEFREMLKLVSTDSLYYHIFDAKLRLGNGENDFSSWFRDLGNPALADEVTHLDPYTYTLEGLRKRLIVLVTKHGKT